MSNFQIDQVTLTPEGVKEVKRKLRSIFSEARSSHITEALAAGLGYPTHAALLAEMKERGAAEPARVVFDEKAFLARLVDLGRD